MLYQSVNYQPISLTSQSNVVISVAERGLAFGDGLFTTAKVADFKVQYLSAHIGRLQEGCKRLFISGVDWQQLSEEVNRTAGLFKSACLKVIITAGEGKRGYAREKFLSPTIIITVTLLPEHYNEWLLKGINVGHSSIKLGVNPLLAGLKHLNRLEQVLIRKELDTLTVDEVLVFDIENNVIECNVANVFWLKEDQWYTPLLDSNGVNGIIRQRILAILPDVKQLKATEKDLHGIQAMFICNALLPVAPVSGYLEQTLDMQPSIDVLQQLKQDATN